MSPDASSRMAGSDDSTPATMATLHANASFALISSTSFLSGRVDACRAHRWPRQHASDTRAWPSRSPTDHARGGGAALILPRGCDNAGGVAVLFDDQPDLLAVGQLEVVPVGIGDERPVPDRVARVHGTEDRPAFLDGLRRQAIDLV